MIKLLISFTETQGREIKSSSEKTSTLAEKYGVSKAQINNIRSGRSWGYLQLLVASAIYLTTILIAGSFNRSIVIDLILAIHLLSGIDILLIH